MNVGSMLFSSSGRLPPRPFAVGIAVVYIASFLSQALLSAPVTNHVGLWPFAAIQAALIWAWLALHIKRLRDAGRGAGFAAGIACLYVLFLILLLLVLAMVTASETTGSNFLLEGQALIHLFVVIYVITAVLSGSEGVLMLWLLGFLLLLLLPLLIGIGFSIWAGTRPSSP